MLTIGVIHICACVGVYQMVEKIFRCWRNLGEQHTMIHIHIVDVKIQINKLKYLQQEKEETGWKKPTYQLEHQINRMFLMSQHRALSTQMTTTWIWENKPVTCHWFQNQMWMHIHPMKRMVQEACQSLYFWRKMGGDSTGTTKQTKYFFTFIYNPLVPIFPAKVSIKVLQDFQIVAEIVLEIRIECSIVQVSNWIEYDP